MDPKLRKKLTLSINYYVTYTLITSKFFGSFPISLKNEKLMISLPWSIYSSVLVIYVKYIGLRKIFEFSNNVSFAAALLEIGYILSFVYTLNLLDIVRTVPILNNFLDEVTIADDSLKKIGVRPVRKIYHIEYLLLDWLTLLFLAMQSPCLFIAGTSVVEQFVWVVVGLGTRSQASQFVGFSSALVDRFACILESLEHVFLSVHYEGRDSKAVLLSAVHKRLCHCGELLQLSFSRRILSTVAVSFVYLIGGLYFLVVSYAKGQIIENLSENLMYLGCAGFALGIILQMTMVSSNLNKQAKEFNVLIYQLMINDRTGTLLGNSKLSLHVTKKREVVFTACDFFNLDYTLIHSIIASTTTFLVILIQFGEPTLTAQPAGTNANTTSRN